jgi:hypothetical protein
MIALLEVVPWSMASICEAIVDSPVKDTWAVMIREKWLIFSHMLAEIQADGK